MSRFVGIGLGALLLCACAQSPFGTTRTWVRAATRGMPCPEDTKPSGVEVGDVVVVQCETADEIVHGWKTSFWPNGRRALFGEYDHGRPHGFITVWHPNGVKSQESRWRGGLRDGRAREWYPSGQLSSSLVFRDGVREGRRLDYYPNGRLMSEARFRGGVQHGRVAAYYPDGSRQAAGEYRRGKADGLWFYWDRSGQLDTIILFRDGRELPRRRADGSRPIAYDLRR